ncbi:MAG TPA: PLP-dependent aminotransferase family protein [Rhizomicrobium sp.]|jgi:DNA-binding transcriptional MocR family regulator
MDTAEEKRATAAGWLPKALGAVKGARYLAVVDALEADILSGRMQPGARLLPQRDMAASLGLSVGTIAKAFAEATRRGLISAEVGRGSFVIDRGTTAQDHWSGPIDLTLNVSPPVGEAELVSTALAALASEGDLNRLLGYLPHPGLPEHRAAAARWLTTQGIEAPIDRIALCNGAQHAISIAMAIAARPGDVVLTEAVTYAGISALAEIAGYRLHGVAMDKEGVQPEALEAALQKTRARVFYCMPRLQTPTGVTMSAARREAIAGIVRKYDAFVVEDDIYSFLSSPDITPLTCLLPERGFHVSSFAKCAGPGLRIGALVMPDWATDRAKMALRAEGWMANPIMAAVVARMIGDGSMAELANRKRMAAAQRWSLARGILGDKFVPDIQPMFHLWLPLGFPAVELITAAAMRGVVLASPTLSEGDAPPLGVRLCLGAPEQIDDLARALKIIAIALEDSGRHNFI